MAFSSTIRVKHGISGRLTMPAGITLSIDSYHDDQGLPHEDVKGRWTFEQHGKFWTYYDLYLEEALNKLPRGRYLLLSDKGWLMYSDRPNQAEL